MNINKKGLTPGGHMVTHVNEKDIIAKFEKVLQKHFGPTGVYILNLHLRNLDRTKEMMQPEDIERLIEGLKEEFIKVIRYDVELLERELREVLKNN